MRRSLPSTGFSVHTSPRVWKFPLDTILDIRLESTSTNAGGILRANPKSIIWTLFVLVSIIMFSRCRSP
ncbi:hypothetical protein MT325_m731R [Paramecium bursaria chlorella virus MT325]|uniref:Uncharacterized protein m731R n=1 Tax=Paramecium bursaria Chlorella virus MT325 TaxID=346932 RepID=A7IVB1_PBCVM|nr:hypothetical protein MT325_m731R [Paramecium bursaria chlorella virus MT325]